MGRTIGADSSPVQGYGGTPSKTQGSAKRPIGEVLVDADEVSSAKRKLIATESSSEMSPVQQAGGSRDGDGGHAAGGSDVGQTNGVASVDVGKLCFTDVVEKKIRGGAWSEREIEWFIAEMTKGNIEDCQIGAYLMAVFIRGMTPSETGHLTRAMMESGETLSWPKEWKGRLVDKHSTGGVGDKVSLILAPALAACGMKVPMISGRGLAHTGGTLDKLESIPGYTVALDTPRMQDILDRVGCCICGQTANLVPADRKLYAIRDVTGTVPSLPLITGSIISKKAAENVDALILDVKCGKAAFSQTEKQGEELARSLVAASNMLGTKATALMTKMDNPIGRCVGNALEVAESLQCLRGKPVHALRLLVEELGGQLLNSLTGGRDGKQQIQRVLDNGEAMGKFREMIIAQGVSEQLANQLCTLPMDEVDEVWQVLAEAECTTELQAEREGYIASLDSLEIAKVCLRLGAGRTVAGDKIDHAVGVRLLGIVGSKVKRGEPWVKVYHQKSQLTGDLISRLQATVQYSDEPVKEESILIKVIE